MAKLQTCLEQTSTSLLTSLNHASRRVKNEFVHGEPVNLSLGDQGREDLVIPGWGYAASPWAQLGGRPSQQLAHDDDALETWPVPFR
jgi:hypothetical protein